MALETRSPDELDDAALAGYAAIRGIVFDHMPPEKVGTVLEAVMEYGALRFYRGVAAGREQT